MWILGIIVLLLILGNLSRKSQNHPLNRVHINPKYPLKSNESTAGDNFNSGNSIVAGVCEPCRIGFPTGPDIPVHAVFPVNPPPIAIQVPRPAVIKPLPISHVQVNPVPFSCDAPPIGPDSPRVSHLYSLVNPSRAISGNAPGYVCSAQLAYEKKLPYAGQPCGYVLQSGLRGVSPSPFIGLSGSRSIRICRNNICGGGITV